MVGRGEVGAGWRCEGQDGAGRGGTRRGRQVGIASTSGRGGVSSEGRQRWWWRRRRGGGGAAAAARPITVVSLATVRINARPPAPALRPPAGSELPLLTVPLLLLLLTSWWLRPCPADAPAQIHSSLHILLIDIS
ncbi:hypothetical protein E2C01_023690 [Portunus trituberculatus]|uniref:Uncharacterized protein n=1 Tax=Portunus trituberculatus TaxID=210409 RepID=A0A5B7EB88_PORTR|nr:hypothetical protein [Portunus trituberculatus]